MTYALIAESVVTDVCRVAPSSIYPRSYAEQFIDAPSDVARGWSFDGVKFTAPPAPAATVPQNVSRRQFKLGLLDMGLLDDVEAMVSASDDRALKINYAEALDFDRHHPFVLAVAQALGKSDAEIDMLFTLAASKL